MGKVKNKRLAIVVFIILAIGVIIYGYYKISGSSKYDTPKTVSEVDKLLTKDLDTNYPGTPREVLKLYSRIIKCYYNTNLKDDHMEKLTAQLRLLFDDELLDNNPEKEHVEQLKAEIKEYHTLKKTITSYTVEKNSSVKYTTEGDKEYAATIVEYLIKEDSEYKKTYEEFILRQDDNGKWKILGWKQTDGSNMEIEQ